jgi:hypothetical protein
MMFRVQQTPCLVVLAGIVLMSSRGFASEAAAPPAARPVRVLLAASGPTREYQYLLHILEEEQEHRTLTVARYLQPMPGWSDERARRAARQDARRLPAFPDHLTPLTDDAADRRAANLASYDVLIAFDLDWQRLSADQSGLVKKWTQRGGGLVLIGGPIHTPELAGTGGAEQLEAIRALCPVVLGEKWPAGKALEANTPKRLSFPDPRHSPAFLRIGPARADSLTGWDDFFQEAAGRAGRPAELQHGFYNALPVRQVKKDATVLALLKDPKAGAVPFLVTMPAGKGRVIYLASGELWRLRGYRVAFHDRLWKELIRYAERGE